MPYDPDKHDRQSIRLPHWDYRTPAAYFVTVCTHERMCLFGEVVQGRMALNAYGRIVAEEWHRSPSIREEIETDAFVVMPNHIHGIVIIAPPDAPRPITPDGYTVHVGTNHGANHVGTHGRASLQRWSKSGRPVRRARSLGAFIAGFKSAATARINRHRGTPGEPVWQGRFYERIIRDEREWHAVRRYIHQNPARWHRDRHHPGR
jgi:REP element-mobilizing transposase RayT